MATDAKTETTTTETWLYAGQRYSEPKRKTYYVWIDPAGEELHFTKTRGGMAGGAYEVDVIRRPDAALSMVGYPRYLAERSDRRPTDAQLETWKAEDRAARQRVEDLRTEKALADDGELEHALETLRRHYGRLRTQAKRGAFISYVTGELLRPAKTTTDEED